MEYLFYILSAVFGSEVHISEQQKPSLKSHEPIQMAGVQWRYCNFCRGFGEILEQKLKVVMHIGFSGTLAYILGPMHSLQS